jgi:hypothetical protein
MSTLFGVSYLETEAATRGVSHPLSTLSVVISYQIIFCFAYANTHFVMQSSDVSGKFSGLHNIKRNSQDASAAERKASWADQAPGTGGILSGMWNNFTKGTK